MEHYHKVGPCSRTVTSSSIQKHPPEHKCPPRSLAPPSPPFIVYFALRNQAVFKSFFSLNLLRLLLPPPFALLPRGANGRIFFLRLLAHP